MDPVLFGRGFALGFVIAAGVGPISLLVIRRTLQAGRVVGLASGLGVATADATYGGLAAFGLTALTDLLVGAGRVLGLVGGLFLVWLAWRTLRSSPPPTAATVAERRSGLRTAYLSILGLTLTNPLTILSFVALFAGLRIPDRAPIDASLLTLGVFAGSAGWWLVLTTAVALLRARLTPRVLGGVTTASGLLIGLFGLAAILLAVRG